MTTILTARPPGIFLSLLLLSWFCVTQNSVNAAVPSDVTMNRDAGRGDGLIVTLRLENGQEGPFLVDSGCPRTILNKSLEPQLGKRLGRMTMNHFSSTFAAGVYAAPKLYLGSVQLLISESNIITSDLTKSDMARVVSSINGPVLGILGMDCLNNYCIQLDFAANKMRFLDDTHLNKEALGKAFPLIARSNGRFNIRDNLVGAKGSGSLIDTGCGYDGWLAPKLFQQWTNQAKLRAHSGARFPNGMLGGETYPDFKPQINPDDDPNDDQRNGIGLRFLARHLVTLDFPKQTMYLKRTSVGPLVDEDLETANAYITNLISKGQLPGCAKDEKGNAFYPEVCSNSATCNIRKEGDPFTYHYTVGRASKDSLWKLQKAWRTDEQGHVLEQYPVP